MRYPSARSLPLALALCAPFLSACAGDAEPLPPFQPEGFADGVSLAHPDDVNPDPHVLEVNLEARVQPTEIVPGLSTPIWTYGGTTPGPLLRLRAGDRLIVHFTNNLPEATTVHWHGVRVPANMDGAPGHSQAPIEPGQTFDYDFITPDAGLYWYHPHEDAAAQLGFGLYGALLVDPPEQAPEPEGLGDEVVLVLSDMGIDEKGALAPPTAGGDVASLFGREGNVVLANGRRAPTLLARSGLRQRWRLVNAARSRYFRVSLPGHTLTRVGGEAGLLEAPLESSELVLLPGSRADVIVRPIGAPGERVPFTWTPYDRGYGSTEFRNPETILNVQIADGDTITSVAPLPALGAPAAPIDISKATPVDIHLTQSTDATGALSLGINGVPWPDAPPFEAMVGEAQVFTVKNDMEWAHPFHLHGFFFQALNEDGSFKSPVERLDTIDVPKLGSARFAVLYDDRPGMWMFHCHILDHGEAGMMGVLHVH